MRLSEWAKKALRFIQRFCKYELGCIAGLKFISDRLGTSTRSLNRYLAELRAANLIRIEYRGRNGMRIFLIDGGAENGVEKQPVSIYTNQHSLRIQRKEEYSTEEVAPALAEIYSRRSAAPLPKPPSEEEIAATDHPPLWSLLKRARRSYGDIGFGPPAREMYLGLMRMVGEMKRSMGCARG